MNKFLAVPALACLAFMALFVVIPMFASMSSEEGLVTIEESETLVEMQDVLVQLSPVLGIGIAISVVLGIFGITRVFTPETRTPIYDDWDEPLFAETEFDPKTWNCKYCDTSNPWDIITCHGCSSTRQEVIGR